MQILSLLISEIWPSFPILQGGNSILLILLAIGIMALFIIGTNIEQLKRKESLIFILILFGLLGVAYWQLPIYFPQIFSISPETAQAIKLTLGSIFG